MEQKTELVYEREGQVQGAVSNIIFLIVGIGVAVLILIFVGVLAGQTYNLTESQIDNISDATIQASVKNSIISGFSALEQTGTFLPIIVLAVVIALVLSLILGFLAFGNLGGMGGGRSAL